MFAREIKIFLGDINEKNLYEFGSGASISSRIG